MDSTDKAFMTVIISVAFLLCFGVCFALYCDYKQAIKMGELGYQQTQQIGKSGILWVK